VLTVFVQYYLTKNPARQKELDTCLQKNIANPFVTQLIIYFEKEADMSLIENNPKIVKRFYPDRMTYGYWLKEVNQMPVGTLSLLLNTDVYLTESVTHLTANNMGIFESKVFIALTRYNPDYKNDPNEFMLNANPHWTQDTWGVVRGEEPFPTALLQEAAFELGQPGCDNKIAYVMHSYGFLVSNPCYSVKSIHLQADDGRSYNPKRSKLLGLHAFVHPTQSVLEKSLLDFDLLTRSTEDPTIIRVNNWINDRDSYDLKGIPPSELIAEEPKEPTSEVSKPAAFDEIKAIAGSETVTSPFESVEGDNNNYPENLIPITKFSPESFRKVHEFSERFSVYDDINSYYFYDKYWPIVNKLSKAELKIDPSEANLIYLFIAGFVPPVLSLGLLSLSGSMEYSDDVLFWQFPCRTEGDAFDTHLMLSGPQIEDKVVNTYLPLPWATFIDKEKFPESIIGIYESRIKAFKEIVYGYGFSLKIHTVCQHIFWKRSQAIFERIGITNLWISHKEKNEDKLGDKIYLHSWPLFAVNYLDPTRKNGLKYIPAKDKTIFASFIGAHMKHYLSDVRLKLKDLANLPGFFIEIKDLWHFNKIVYNFQVRGEQEHKDATDQDVIFKYNNTLSQSLFSLCPVGAGPNSLRFWESLAVGSIPVVLSDTYQLPSVARLGLTDQISWDDAVIFQPEARLEELERRLRSIPPEKLQDMQDAGRKLFNAFQNLVCFGEIKRDVTHDLNVLDLFKPQQIQNPDSNQAIFDGKASLIPAIFSVGDDWVEKIIFFDQAEKLGAINLSIDGGKELQIDVEISTITEYGKFSPLINANQLKAQINYRLIDWSAKEVRAMGLKFRLKSNQSDIANVKMSVEVFNNDFSTTIKSLDKSGVLKVVSDDNPRRKDRLFESKNINNGNIFGLLSNAAKQTITENQDMLFPEILPRKMNLIGEPLSEGVTMYVHLMNRNQNVEANLKNWLAQSFNELILLDWSSDDPVAQIKGVFDDPRVRVVRVDGQKKFIRTIAQNLATQMSRYDKVFKCDSDVLIEGDFFKSHPLSKGEFWVGDWHQGRDHNERHLHGETYYHVDDFFMVNGYDERIFAYGQDDTNLKDRMLLAGLIKKVFFYNQLHHIHHEQSLRVTNQDISHPMIKTYENRIASMYLPLWNAKYLLRKFEWVQPTNSSSDYEKEGRVVTLNAEEIKTTPVDPSIQVQAVNEVAGWYVDKEQLAKMSMEEKIKLVWERQSE